MVDDNPATCYSTSRVLRNANYEVVEAGTGHSALASVQEGVDLVVLDVNLPDIDGFEVCRQIRSMPEWSRLPVVHLSATFVRDVDRIHGLEMGANGYLVHPVEPPVLVATVAAFLRLWHAEQERETLLSSERAARAEAERANRFKDEFLATLSHELRTPLQAIIGWTQLLKTDSLSPEEVTEAVAIIERNAQAQSQMIADLLDVSRINSGKLRLDVQSVDVALIIEAALTAIMPAAAAKGIRLLKQLDTSAGPIVGDPSRLQQVIWNLVSNAVKFTPKNGRIQVTLQRRDSFVEVGVADDGPGIEPDLLPRIFDRFRQGDASTTRVNGGLGLGLAIAKQLTELHGGSITAESVPGKGAQFHLQLPIQAVAPIDTALSFTENAQPDKMVEPGVPAITEPPPAVSLRGIRILLVDDNHDSRRMLARTLQNANAVTEDVASAAEAMAIVEEFRPHILISDLGMPDRDGYDLIKTIRELGHAFPAIALTGFARSEDRQRTMLSGFQSHLAKPVDYRDLLATVATLVRK